jgi:hypothetical protein
LWSQATAIENLTTTETYPTILPILANKIGGVMNSTWQSVFGSKEAEEHLGISGEELDAVIKDYKLIICREPCGEAPYCDEVSAEEAAELMDDFGFRLSERERRSVAKAYALAAGRAEILEVLPFAAVERLIQCLGAYGRLVSVGKKEFGKYVLPALENLLAAADESGLDAVGALAEDLIAAETSLTRGDNRQ